MWANKFDIIRELNYNKLHGRYNTYIWGKWSKG